jgi:diaminopimelate decarboxylase
MIESHEGLRAGCEGVVALPARLEAWQREVCNQPERAQAWIEEHGSPVNVLCPSPMAGHVAELRGAAERVEVDLGIYFARKANKALAFVDEARRLGLGIDLASERELAQVLDMGIPGSALVMTAAVKPAGLLELCVASGTTVVVDNADELRRLPDLADAADTAVSVALRLAPTLADDRPQTRFGFGVDEAIAVLDDHLPPGSESNLTVDGVHFHLDGYAAAERVTAIGQALDLIDGLRERGHQPAFVDMGGGIPMSYIASATQWDGFWREHRRGLLGERAALTFDGHGLGLLVHNGEIIGRPAVYPYHQSPTRGAWLSDVLAGRVREASVAEGLRGRGLQLRCEPGRALLDGCGLTAARVAHRKRRRDGTWLISLEMNRTQCRSTSDDFMVDPLLLRPGAADQPDGSPGPIEGYLVGAYCIERELLTWRRMRFAHGVEVGDIVVFPNTAGYLMHILESSSHQIPLARNLVLGADGLEPMIDAIDQ